MTIVRIRERLVPRAARITRTAECLDPCAIEILAASFQARTLTERCRGRTPNPAHGRRRRFSTRGRTGGTTACEGPAWRRGFWVAAGRPDGRPGSSSPEPDSSPRRREEETGLAPTCLVPTCPPQAPRTRPHRPRAHRPGHRWCRRGRDRRRSGWRPPPPRRPVRRRERGRPKAPSPRRTPRTPAPPGRASTAPGTCSTSSDRSGSPCPAPPTSSNMRFKHLLLFGSSICLLLLNPVSALAANNTYVAPFNPGSFTAGIPSDTDSARTHAILNNTNKYALTT